MSTEAEASAGSGGTIEPTNVQTSSEVTASGASDLPAPGEGTDASNGGGELAPLRGGRIVDVIVNALTFTLVIARLGIAAAAMRLLSEAVNGAYSYVEDCAKTVDGLADVAASLAVDDSVTSAHHDAAATMRESLALADALAEEAAEMSTEFDNAARDHASDYGDVNEAMQSGTAAVAEREWYSNR
ncbi:hypothetical protein [Streptomyces sp. NPDC003688]